MWWGDKGLSRWLSGKESACQCRRWDTGLIPGSERSPEEGNDNTHSSILAWRIPWTEEPGGLQYIGLQRVGHDWATEHGEVITLWKHSSPLTFPKKWGVTQPPAPRGEAPSQSVGQETGEKEEVWKSVYCGFCGKEWARQGWQAWRSIESNHLTFCSRIPGCRSGLLLSRSWFLMQGNWFGVSWLGTGPLDGLVHIGKFHSEVSCLLSLGSSLSWRGKSLSRQEDLPIMSKYQKIQKVKTWLTQKATIEKVILRQG